MEGQDLMKGEHGGVGRVYRTESSWASRSSAGGVGNPGGYGAVHISGQYSNEGNSEMYKGNNGTRRIINIIFKSI